MHDGCGAGEAEDGAVERCEGQLVLALSPLHSQAHDEVLCRCTIFLGNFMVDLFCILDKSSILHKFHTHSIYMYMYIRIHIHAQDCRFMIRENCFVFCVMCVCGTYEYLHNIHVHVGYCVHVHCVGVFVALLLETD